MSDDERLTPDQWAELKRLFERALEVPSNERERWLESECGDDELRRQLRLLIEHDAEAGSFLEPTQSLSDTAPLANSTVLLNRFQIVRFLGRGGMGEVYEAEDRDLGVHVALKTIRADFASNPQYLRRFKREVQIARKITHPNVCRIHELFFEGRSDAPRASGLSFLTMEYLAGESLSARLRSGKMDEAEARSIVLQLCAALDAAHEAGIVHRDLKSANVMLVPVPGGVTRAVVTDFGLAREAAVSAAAAGGLSRAGAIIGTPGYMAPEQADGQVAGCAADIYALGVVMHEILAGRRPIAGRADVLTGDVCWSEAIERCLNHDPALRPKSAGDVALMLRPAEPSRRDSFFKRREVVVGLALLGIVVTSLVAWKFWPSGYQPPSRDAQRWYDEGTAALREGTYLKASRALERAVQIDRRFVLAHARLADAWTELDFTDKAKDEMLLASSPEFSRGLPHVDREYVDAVRATITNDLDRAVTLYKHILGDLSDASKAYGWVDLGRAYEKAGKTQDALNAYVRASQLAPEYPASFIRAGILDGRLKRHDEGAKSFERAEALYRASSNIEGLAEVDYQRGATASLEGRLDAATAATDRALTAARQIPSVQLEIRALLQMSGVDHRNGQLERSERYAAQAIHLARENGIGFWATQGVVLLGHPYFLAEDYAKAESYYLEGLKLAQKSGSQRMEAFAQINLASLRSKQGRLDEAAGYAKSALEYYRARGFVSQANTAIVLLARVQRDRGDLDGAQKTFEEELALGEKAHDPNIAAHAEEGLGGIFERREDYPAALRHYRLAGEVGKELGADYLEHQATHVAGALVSLGRFVEYEEIAKTAKSDEKPDLIIAWTRVRANAALARTRNKEAAEDAQRTLKSVDGQTTDDVSELMSVWCVANARLGRSRLVMDVCAEAPGRARDKFEESAANLALAEASLSAERLADAKRFIDTSLVEFMSRGQRDSQWHSLLLLSRLYVKEGNKVDSAKNASAALDIIDRLKDNWGTTDLQTYKSRPDIAANLRELASYAGRD